MGATNIGSSKYPLAKIPAMADPADIQIALKYYHWGQETEPESTPTAGITSYLANIEDDIAQINTSLDGVVLESVIDQKGDLLVGTGNDAVDNLTVGSDGYVLTADTNATLGIKWAAPTVASSQITGLGTGIATWLSSPTSANLATAITDETGSGSLVFSSSPTFTGTVTLPTTTSIGNVSSTEIGYIDGVTSSIQTQLDAKSPLNFSTNAQTGTSYSLVKTDNGYIVEMNNSSANTVTIPLNAGVNGDFPIGSQVTIIQTGAGQTTVNVTAGVTLNCTPQTTVNTAKLRAQWSSCTLIKRAVNTWIAIGDLVA